MSELFQDLPYDFNAGSGSAGMTFCAASDNVFHNWDQAKSRVYDGGSWNAQSNPLDCFNACYKDISKAYYFLDNVDNVPIKNANQVELYNYLIPIYKAEAKFFIAYNYFRLLQRYGAVPIIDKFYTINDNETVLKIPRSSTDEVVSFITNMLDEAAEHLPETYDVQYYGHITKGAALALKAKTLLYAASPLFNGGEIDGVPVSVDGKTVKETILSVKNKDGKELFDKTYDKEKWKKAADAAKAVLKLADKGIYSLNPDRASLFYNKDFSEYILWKQIGGNKNWDKALVPNGTDYGGTGALGPTQELIDSYEMNNGLSISDPNSNYNETGYKDTLMNVYRKNKWQKVKVKIRNMYCNRDPRFYTDIFFNGMPYLKRNVETEYDSKKGNNTDGWGKSGQSTRTGYYCQKWVAPGHDLKSSPSTIYRNCPIIRLAEVYLWYAEALNEYSGPSQEVYDAVNKVRNRVGMPSLPLTAADKTKAGLRERIHNERRIELAFEHNHRFFDIRRWLVAQNLTNVTGMNINGSGDAFYTRTLVRQRVFKLPFFLFPIPVNETSIAPALVQNYGW
ncbi:MAG: RagB/SusD family nutrient uptake outer membrane protein [Bacteroidales bacterium]|nr:RagB/SusD family nutrient uptake outer membrane protein [Bacteroidales bacterium]